MKRLQLCPHDREWLETFEVERERVTAALGPLLLHIEHVGSTSVPGLLAKPVVDIAVAVGSPTEANFCIEPLQALGYEYRGLHGDDERRRYYVLERAGRRMVQIHLWILPAAGWDRMLRFREVLRDNVAVREAYAREKLRVAELVNWDKAAYSLGKGPFIESIATPEAAALELLEAAVLAQRPFEEIVEPITRSFDESGMSEEELDELVTQTRQAIRKERRRDK